MVALSHGRSRFCTDAVPWVTSTDAEIGRVGLTESQRASASAPGVTVERHPYPALDHAITAGKAYGFAKLVADPRGRLVGRHGGRARRR